MINQELHRKVTIGRPKSNPPSCHPERKYFARDMCKSCYWKWYWPTHPEAWENKINRGRKWNTDNKDKQRNRMLKCEYGITSDEFDELHQQQSGKCIICGQNDSKRLHVDHDHDSGKVRGLLCFNCNRGLGSFKDNPGLLRMAAKYIESQAVKNI